MNRNAQFSFAIAAVAALAAFWMAYQYSAGIAAKPKIVNYVMLNDQRTLATILMTIAMIAFFSGVTQRTRSRKIYLLAYCLKWSLLLLMLYGVLNIVSLMSGMGSGPAVFGVLTLGYCKFSTACKNFKPLPKENP